MGEDLTGQESTQSAESDTTDDDSKRGLLRRSRPLDVDSLADRLQAQFAQQWAQVRAQQRPEPAPIRTGPSNFSRAQVPWGLDLAAAWAWRLMLVTAMIYGLYWVLNFFAVITVPVVIALLLAALSAPVVSGMVRIGIPRGIAAGIVVVGGLAFVAIMLTMAGQQVAQGASDLAEQVVKGLDEVKAWLRDGPLKATDSQINGYIEQAQATIAERSRDGQVVTRVTEVGTALGHVVAGFFIILFSSYFFLADGQRIWSWLVRIAPRAARIKVDSSGRVAWHSLTKFVQATVLVALVDAIGIMIVAAILKVPFIFAIGVLVFLGAFVPMVGATVAGTVAILVALVDQGPPGALFMLIGVIVVQQFEGHVLQPFLMGRFVSVHPLGVILALAMGIIVAGIAGALIAVPLAAALNAVCQHLATYTAVGDDPSDKLDEEIGPDRPTEPAEPSGEQGGSGAAE